MPPAELTKKCPITEPSGVITNGKVAVLAKDRAFDTERCNLQLKAIKAWYDGYERACGWRCRQRKD